MKLNSTIAAIVLGLGTASVASATNYIYFTGSTAARAAVFNALSSGVGFDGHTAPSVIVTYSSSTPANCSYMEFVGTIGGVQTIVKCSWSGSEAGITDVSGSGTRNFLADPGTGGVLANGNSSSTPTGAQLVASTVNLAMADNSITYSQTPGSTAVQQGPAVVIPFVFVKNYTSGINTSGFTNITSDQFRTLAAGATDLALFTGSNPTTGYNVYLTGRDNQSGTRANTFGLTGFGINKNPNQVILTPSGTTAPVTASLNYTGTTNAATIYTASGQSSGGTLAKSLGDTTAAFDWLNPVGDGTYYQGFVVVTYLGLADAATAEGAPYNAIQLSYNGVSFSTNSVQNGTYAVWGNEYVLSKSGSPSNVTGLQSALANTTTGIAAHTSGAEIPMAAMLVKRSGPTSSPTY